MKVIYKSVCCFLFIFFVIFSSVISANEKLPSSLDIRELKQSYQNATGDTGKLIAYIPIKKPCLNVLSEDEHKEFCFIDGSTTEDLSKSDKSGFFITLSSVGLESVSFEYHTMWYSTRCRYFTFREKPTCDEPYTN
ncbi:hypothetical protein BCU90_08755 [Vibrio lentus]|uniref:hypothetical protein n=1 Tax=Vibrio TaxID=662 RepID=UPI0007EEC46D|nr:MULTISPECIES: hypothetical protein [Vibrio]OBT19878.1 hypothetical protein A9266_14560 [Vibrio tasmaniensis]PMG48288.1 hypothetical protein BCU90_08755 [Vibrio lentus]PTQ17995.1 hypothetical protein CWO33_00290 [Vibrio splendidus]